MGNNPAKRKGRKTEVQIMDSMMAKADYIVKQQEKNEKRHKLTEEDHK